MTIRIFCLMAAILASAAVQARQKPFLFYDPDKDHLSEMAIRLLDSPPHMKNGSLPNTYDYMQLIIRAGTVCGRSGILNALRRYVIQTGMETASSTTLSMTSTATIRLKQWSIFRRWG